MDTYSPSKLTLLLNLTMIGINYSIKVHFILPVLLSRQSVQNYSFVGHTATKQTFQGLVPQNFIAYNKHQNNLYFFCFYKPLYRSVLLYSLCFYCITFIFKTPFYCAVLLLKSRNKGIAAKLVLQTNLLRAKLHFYANNGLYVWFLHLSLIHI